MTPDSSGPCTGPRAMAEQDILRIIWPPDGRVPWEDRRKVPEIERTIGHLLDVLETGGNYMEPPMSPEASYHVTQKIVDLKASGYTEVQIAEMTGLTKDAVHNRICRYRQRRQTTKAQGVPALDQSVEVDKMIADMGSAGARPSANDAAMRSAADHIVEANDIVVQVYPEVEQVSGQASLPGAKPEQNENPTIRRDRIVEESAKVRPAKVPLTDEQKGAIHQLHQEGRSNTDIAATLGIDPRRVQGTIIARRKPAKNVPAVQPGYLPSQPAEDLQPKPTPVQEARPPTNESHAHYEPQPFRREPIQEARPLTNEDRRQTLLDMKIDRLSYSNTPAQIAEKLSVPGDVWTEDMVNERLQKIRGRA